MRTWAIPWLALALLVFPVVARGAEAKSDSATLCTKTPKAEIRQGPGREFPVKYLAPVHMAFLLMERKGSWLQIRDVDGQLLWVHRSLVRERDRCITINADDVNMRWKPDRYAGVMFKTDRYASFRVVESRGDWLGVRYYELTVWVHRSLVWPD